MRTGKKKEKKRSEDWKKIKGALNKSKGTKEKHTCTHTHTEKR